MFGHLLCERADPQVIAEYDARMARISQLIDAFVPDDYTRRKIRCLAELKYRQALVKPTLIPSRLGKRLNTIFLTQSGLDDPYRERKRLFNRRAFSFIQSEACKAMLYACPEIPADCRGIPELRHVLDMLELRRSMVLGTMSGIWEGDGACPGQADLEAVMQHFPAAFAPFETMLDPRRGSLKILYLPDSAGGVLFDLLAVRSLLRMGHRVILAFKDGFYFDNPTIWDIERDPILDSALAGAHFLSDQRVTKNTLLQVMCDLLKSQQEFSFSAEVTEEQVYPNGQTISLTRIVEVAVKRPDKLYARIVGDGRDRVFVYDGKTVTVADLDRDVYATVETPPTIDATLDMLATKYGLAAPLSDLLHSDPCAVMLEDVRTGDFVGRHLAAGKVTDHLAFSQKEADWQIWVEDGPKPLPRKFVLNDKEVMGWPQFAATFTAWNLNPHLSAKLFVFTPEPDARRIDCPPQGCEPVEKK